MKGKIAIALDGSPLAEKALPFAINLAKMSDASLLLLRLTVLPVEVEDAYARENPHQLRPLAYLENVKTTITTNPDENLRLDPDRVGIKVGRGKFAYEIPEVAEVEEADLIVITTHGLGGFTRLLMGSVTQQILRNSKIPVIVLRPDHAPVNPKKAKKEEAAHTVNITAVEPKDTGPGRHPLILAALLDGEPTAEAVLDPVCRLAEKLKAEVKLLQVVFNVQPVMLDEPVMQILYSPEDQNEDLRYRHAEAARYLEQMKTELAAYWTNLSFETEILTGRPAEELVKWSTRSKPFLMALATHARGEVGRFVLGSVADEIMREGACPLLMVHIPKDYPGWWGKSLQETHQLH